MLDLNPLNFFATTKVSFKKFLSDEKQTAANKNKKTAHSTDTSVKLKLKKKKNWKKNFSDNNINCNTVLKNNQYKIIVKIWENVETSTLVVSLL